MAINRDSFVKNVLADGSIVARGITPADLSQLPDSSTDFATAVGKGTKTITTYNKKKAQRSGIKGLRNSALRMLMLSFSVMTLMQSRRPRSIFKEHFRKICLLEDQYCQRAGQESPTAGIDA